jgi:hypothetical protein
MNVEIGAEAVQFPEKEYVNGIAFAVSTKIHKETSEEQVYEMTAYTYEASRVLLVVDGLASLNSLSYKTLKNSR